MSRNEGLLEQRHLLWRLMTENGLRHWKGYAISLVFMSLIAATTGLSAWLMKDVINEIFISRNQSMVLPIAVAVLAIFLVKGVASYAQMVILARIGNRIVADIQMRMFDHVLRQRVDFFEKFSIGDVTARFSHNSQSAREALNLVATSLGRDLLSVIALTIVMVLQDPTLALLALLVAPPAILGVAFLIEKIGAVARAEFLSLAKIVTTIQETALGSKVVKAFALEPVMREEMQAAVDGVRIRADKMAQISAAANPLVDTLGGIAVGLTIVYAGWRVIDGGADPGSFFSFITALLMVYEPARRLARLHVNLRGHLVGVEIMYKLLDEKPKISEAQDPVPIPLTGGEIRFDDVHFKYDDVAALNGVTFTAETGKTTALIGPSGGGKSTIFSMILRYYDPLSGSVSINGVDLQQAQTTSLRQMVSSVSQNPFLFGGTVRRNIELGRPGASEDEIIEAAKNANAHDFIMELKDGYDAQIGEDGARLSGGQRQRIAIARAMLHASPILLLDEATASLDAEAEARINEALDRLMEGRTTIVIAHRLSTVRHADKLIIVDRGEVVQCGSHDELIGGEGLYKRLYDLQFSEMPAR